jgi:GTP-binding protein HflX
LDELELLADTAGADVLERVVQERDRIDPAFMIGRGKVVDLTPAQVRNIENLCDIKVLDRSGLILDIFATHARTKEARIQVEVAQLNYLIPRLTRQWTHLSRQVGGIGVRGPGETQLEVDRRLIRRRIRVLENELVKIAKQRIIRKTHRADVFKAALIGYTNVGKSTLLNSMTDARVLVEDRLFATLDPTVRAVELSDNRRVLLIDTVGFIRKLPHHLIASFKSTLEEAADADLLLHVIDITHPNHVQQMKTVDNVLKELSFDEKPVLKVFNKIDALEDTSFIPALKKSEAPCVCVSAERGMFLNELKETIRQFAEQSLQKMHVILPVNATKTLSQLREMAVVTETDYNGEFVTVKVVATPIQCERIRHLIGTDNEIEK